jgi:serine/threonine protein kinase/tetratricopeptide (TPR) repeat protein
MIIERWEHVKELVHRAMQLAPREQASFLDDACSADPAIRAEVESLLLAEAHIPSSFLEKAPLADRIGAEADKASCGVVLQAGRIFAERFQLVRKVGEGGMGQVWLAEQLFPVRRQVALKLVKSASFDVQAGQRFQSERQSLAVMDHPAIAKVFDAGTTPCGQPYFVMEYVPGLPITEYCDRKMLKIKERLELFIQACEGVQHAHQKSILHRDLKPANILVMEVDDKPAARIIDFGLAKATSPPVVEESLVTQFGSLVGTPGYMSPEQADPSGQDVDTRADVYALGVILYMLLTGVQPLDTKQWKNLPLHELLRKLREEEPPRPSRRVGSNPQIAEASAEARCVEPKQLTNLLRGDLDWITMKSLEKDRAQRYGTPSELAADIRRHLHYEPVLARPASAGYRLRKYARRHRVAAGVATGVALWLLVFSIFQTAELRRITRERDRATRITDFMTAMFSVSDPSESRGNRITAREILDKASNDMRTGLARDPEVQSQFMDVMARTYTNLGLYSRAHELAKRAFAAQLSLLGPDDPKTLESMTQLGWILDREGHDSEADKLERQALAGERRVLGPDDPLTLRTLDYLVVILEDQGHYREAETLARQVIAAGSRRLGPESAQTLMSVNHLGRALWYQARYSEAELEYRRLREVDRRVLGPDHPQTLAATVNLAVAVQAQHRLADAEQLYRDVLAAQQRVLGLEHQSTALTMENLAALISPEGRLVEGEKLHREALRIRLRTLGPEHPETLMTELNLADVLLREGRIQEADKLQQETLQTQFRVLGPQNPETLESQSNLAAILIREGRFAEAEKIAREAFAVQVRTLGMQHPDTLDTLRQIGKAMAYSHRYAEASKLFRDAIAEENKSQRQGNDWSAWYGFACIAVAAGRRQDAIGFLREAIHRGYADANSLMAEDDLKNLRHERQFQELVAGLKEPYTGVQAP